MIKRLILLLLFSLSFVSFAQKGVRVINNKGTVIYVDPSKWFQVAGNLYNKNGTGNVAIGLDTTATVGARLVVNGDGILPPLMLKNVLFGAVTDDVLTWNSVDGSVRKIDRNVLVAEPWYDMATSKGATLNTQDVYIMGKAAVGTNTPITVASATSGSSVLQQKAYFTVAGGDASINGLTIGLGGGQKSVNTAIGYQALFGNSSSAFATNNVAVGYQALTANTSGASNTAIGSQALTANTSGSSNIAIGYQALTTDVSGSANTAIGTTALKLNTGSNNTAIGAGALVANTTGNFNTSIGLNTLKYVTTGTNNIAIGANAGNSATPLTTGNYNIVIGANSIDVPSPTGNNQLNIANTIFGTGTSGSIGAGNIGIGNVPTPNAKLEVNSGTANTSGLRLTQLTSATPVTTGTRAIGVNVTGDVVTTDLSATVWSRSGNTGTTPGTDFIGTTDAKDWVIKTNNTEAARVTSNGQLLVNTPTSLTGGSTAKLQVNNGTTAGAIQIVDGTQGLGKVLTSDANGLATWGTDNNWKTIGNTSTTAAISSGGYGTAITSGNFIGTTDAKDWVVASNNTERMRVLSGGNVVIGATSAATVAGVSSGSAVPQRSAYFTLVGGDAAINSLTIGRGGGQNPGNTAIGNQALFNNNGATAITAIGNQALFNNTSGINNTAIGYSALKANITGNDNTATGANTLLKNTGSYNVAFGSSSLQNNMGGSKNVVTGSYALYTNSIGSNNVAIGDNTLFSSTGSDNIALGKSAGYGQTSGSSNIIIGTSMELPSLTGSNQLNIGNTIFGTGTNTSTAGAGNIGIGTTNPNAKLEVQSSTANTSGLRLTNLTSTSPVSTGATVIGVNANGDVVTTDPTSNVWKLTGNANTINGTNFIGTTDAQPLAFRVNGQSAGWLGIEPSGIGTSNAYFGYNAGQSGRNTSIVGNVALGDYALSNNTLGNYNVAVGSGAYQYSSGSGSNNVAIGLGAMNKNTTGNSNIALGVNALNSNSVGNNQIAIGSNSGASSSSGNDNVFIGSNANATVASLTNATAIGLNAKVGASNSIVLGGTGADAVNVGIGTTIPVEKLDVNGTVNANNFISPVQTLTSGAWDLSKGANAKWTLVAGLNTLTITNMKAGMYGSIIVTNTTGTSTIVFGAGNNKVINGGGGVVTLTPIAGAIDVISFFYDGSVFLWTIGNNFN